jgi:hypothetical protein
MNSLVKTKLFELIGNSTIPMQYGGGLDDAYMNRSSAFADPNATSAFADPNNPSAFIPDRFPVSSNKAGGLPTIYREDGGTTIPKERMINDQPHQLSYINPEEAGLLQALGGSGRKVDGIPSYFYGYDSNEESGYATGGEEGYGADGNYDGPSYSDDGIGYDVPAESADQEDLGFSIMNTGPVVTEKDDEMYKTYADAYSNQMSVDPNDPSGYLDSYADDFGRTGFGGLFGPTRTRNEALKENEAALRDAYGRAYGEERGNLVFNQQLAAPGSYSNVAYSFGRPGDFEGAYTEGLEESLTTTNVKGEKVVDTENIETIADLYGLKYKAVDGKKSEDGPMVAAAKQVGKFVAGAASPALGAAMGLYGLLNNNNKVGTLTDPKTGMSFSLNKDGTVTNDDPVSSQLDDTIDYGNDAPEKRRRPVQQKVVSTAKDKPLTGMAALLARRSKPTSRLELDDKASGQDKFEKIYNRRYRNI